MKFLKEKKLMIIVFMAYVLSVLLFEFGYCNSSICINFLCKETPSYYSFSLARIVIYVVFFVVLFFARNKIFAEACELFSKKKNKRILVYIYSAITFILCIVGIIYIWRAPLAIRKVSSILITALMGQVFVIGISNNIIKNVIITIFSLGIMFSIITDFNHAIDEKKHFATAFNIAFGNFDYVKNPITDKRIESLRHIIDYTEIDYLMEDRYESNITDDVNLEDASSTPANYNCIAYLFPAIGIWFAKTLGGTIIDLYIMGRLFNLVLYCVLICIAIKLLPCKKNIFATVCLLPISLVLAGTYSIDGFCIGVVSIFIAYCINIKYNSDSISLKQACILFLLFILMLTAKSMAYIMVAFIIFVLPLKKTIVKNKKYIPVMTLVLLMLAIGTFSVAKIVKKSNITADSRAGDNIDVSRQIDYLIHNPVADLKLGFNHIRDTFGSSYWYTMLQEDKFFSTSAQYILIPMLIFVLYVAVTEEDYVFKVKDKIILSISFIFTYAMTSLVLYLCFSQVGAEHIGGYQTRYILPIMPLILMGLANKNLLILNKENRNYRIAITSGIIVVLTIFQSIVKI